MLEKIKNFGSDKKSAKLHSKFDQNYHQENENNSISVRSHLKNSHNLTKNSDQMRLSFGRSSRNLKDILKKSGNFGSEMLSPQNLAGNNARSESGSKFTSHPRNAQNNGINGLFKGNERVRGNLVIKTNIDQNGNFYDINEETRAPN